MPNDEGVDVESLSTDPLRQRLARVETEVTTLTRDNQTNRGRLHDLSNEIQRLIGEVSGLGRLIERIDNTIDARAIAVTELASELKNHVSGCRDEALKTREDAIEARGERLAFRREMRRYMVTILIALITAFFAGKFHVTLGTLGITANP